MLSLVPAVDLSEFVLRRPLGTGEYVGIRAGHGTGGGTESRYALSAQERLTVLQTFYATANPQTVWRLLDKLPDAEQVLLEAIFPIRYYFGSDATVTLSVFRDPEGSSRTLFADISAPLDLEEALRRLDLFDSEWFLPRLPSHLNFALAVA